MPIYDYECPNGHSFEAIRMVKDRLTVECPECQATGIQVILGGPTLLYNRMGTDTRGLPTAAAKWERMHKQRAAVRK